MASHSSEKGQTPKSPSTYRISPFPPTPTMAMDPSYQNASTSEIRPSARTSNASRLSSWIVASRGSRRSIGAGDRNRLWNQDEAEKGESVVNQKVLASDGRGSPYSYDSAIERPTEAQGWKDPMASTMMNDPAPQPRAGAESRWTTTTVSSKRNSSDANSAGRAPGEYSEAFAPPNRRMQSDVYSIGSYYGDTKARRSSLNAPSIATITRNTDSPVYGLDGIVQRTNQGRQIPGSAARTRSSAMSFTELLRQQTELDKSIAALRLFSPQQESTRMETTLPTESTSRSRSNSSIGVPSSMKSEFSLSHFPEPPELVTGISGTSSPIPAVALMTRTDRKDSRKSRFVPMQDASASLPPPRMPILSDYPSSPQSIPNSPTRQSEGNINMSRSAKIDSAGTQYDVTSFIGSMAIYSLFINSLLNFPIHRPHNAWYQRWSNVRENDRHCI